MPRRIDTGVGQDGNEVRRLGEVGNLGPHVLAGVRAEAIKGDCRLSALATVNDWSLRHTPGPDSGRVEAGRKSKENGS